MSSMKSMTLAPVIVSTGFNSVALSFVWLCTCNFWTIRLRLRSFASWFTTLTDRSVPSCAFPAVGVSLTLARCVENPSDMSTMCVERTRNSVTLKFQSFWMQKLGTIEILFYSLFHVANSVCRCERTVAIAASRTSPQQHGNIIPHCKHNRGATRNHVVCGT